MHYPGGKAKTFHQIVNLIPPHDVYIEPYLGLGSVLRNKKPAEIEFGIDLDERVLQDTKLSERGVRLLRTDAIEFLGSYDFGGHEVVYCDPPYLPATRKRRRIYRHETDQSHHERLLETICAADARVLISGYESELYCDALNSWNVHRFVAKTHGGIREECVWYNFEAPTILHDYRYLGRNFRERQVIKRRIDRLKKRISMLPPVEQACIKEWLIDRGHPDAA